MGWWVEGFLGGGFENRGGGGNFGGGSVKHYRCLGLSECIISVFVWLLLVTVGDSYGCFGVISCGLCHFLGFWRR